ncbi:FAD binding domain-containing protein [Paenibacillus sp. N4]|uniref:FAD binding domain-containing protein n=1 Tax=Paenibacillus vietnamensis TaxID=2590547 RepID=UPI001CD061E0|nr:FAD binding domain-containing protein [Paenibacillus vietnamensis]MCA0754167.1 FAD binding domain-containing protein [Paenibacillus vietnamensis]
MTGSIHETPASPHVWQPKTAEEAWQCKQACGSEGIYIAGGTLLHTRWEAGIAAMPPHLIDISGIDGLNGIKIGEAGLELGSAVSLQACRNHPMLLRRFPLLTEAMRAIAAPSVRHLGTIGGNVLSIVGDSITALLAYDAALVWFNGQSEQTEKLTDWLPNAAVPGYTDDRLLLRIVLPLEGADDKQNRCTDLGAAGNKRHYGAFHKIGRREAFTPSVVTAAVLVTLSEAGEIETLRIAAGGGQTVPARLEEAEQDGIGKQIDTDLLRRIYERVGQIYKPQEDAFATSAYRKQTAANLIVTELWKAGGGIDGQGG